MHQLLLQQIGVGEPLALQVALAGAKSCQAGSRKEAVRNRSWLVTPWLQRHCKEA